MKKNDSMLYSRLLAVIVFIVLFSYILFTNREITSYKEKSNTDEITIRNNLRRIMELEGQIEKLRELYDSENEVVDETEELTGFCGVTKEVEYKLSVLMEPNKVDFNTTKKIVDDTLFAERVWLIPQEELSYSDIFELGVTRPYVYEYVDDSIFIYYFTNTFHFNLGLDDIEETFKEYLSDDIYQYVIEGNILMIYIPSDLGNTELTNEQTAKLEKALIIVEEKMESY